MDPNQSFALELQKVLLFEAQPAFQRWARRALVNHGCLEPTEATSQTVRADLSALLALLLDHWPALAAENGGVFTADMKGRFHRVRHIRNRLAHYVPAVGTDLVGLLEHAATIRSFLETISADSALLARTDSILQEIFRAHMPASGTEAANSGSLAAGARQQEMTIDDVRRVIEETLATSANNSLRVPEVLLPSPVPTSAVATGAAPRAAPGVQALPSPPAEPKPCPLCGKPMVVRTAKRGRTVGSRFWGCAAYPRCTGTLPDDDLNVGLSFPDVDGAADDSFAVLAPRSPVMSPLRHDAESHFFEYLTVARAELEATQDQSSPAHGTTAAQWRMEFRPADRRTRHEQGTMRALGVAEKILRRGRLTLLSPSLESKLLQFQDNPSLPFQVSVASDVAFETDRRSPAERAFVIQFAASAGDGWHRWLSAQADITSFTGTQKATSVVGQIDFVVTLPSLKRPIAVEIDGSQHELSTADPERDRLLGQAGYEVVRLRSADVLSSSSEQVSSFLQRIARESDQPGFEEAANKKIRRAGQVQASLLHLAIQGELDFRASNAVEVSSDLIGVGVFTIGELQLVLDDLAELIRRCGTLYGETLLAGGFAATLNGGLQLVFSDPLREGPTTVCFSDIALPFRLSIPSRTCTPSLPVAFDKAALDWFLWRIFGKDSLYPEQYTAVARALGGMDSVVLLPTGRGKSIAFQLAGFLLPGRTVVVAPLVSLIRDQAMVLAGHGIDRVLPISGDLRELSEKEAAYRLVQEGDPLLIYVSPERFQIQKFREALRGMTMGSPVAMLAIDEAHCVSEWGHDFRPSYLRIGRTAREVSTRGSWTPPLMALTGTASRMVLRDLQRELDILDYDALITPGTFDRPELQFAISSCDSTEKESQLTAMMRDWLPGEFGKTRGSFHAVRGADSYCGLIFCPWVNGDFGVTTVQAALSEQGLQTEIYAGKAPKTWSGDPRDWDRYKKKVERSFKRNEVLRIACTKAFGMGIDKPNVRYTVHYGMPASIESFYQEAGRAGRDNRQAWCALLVSEFDARRNAWLLSPDNPVEKVAERLNAVQRNEEDDITRALYFETRSFKGLPAEQADARRLLQVLGALDRRRKLEVAFRDEQEVFERVFHRLTVLGIVSDYTINYAAKTALLTLSGASAEEAIAAYVQYVRGYQVARSNEERRKAELLLAGGDRYAVFVAKVLDLYLHFVYDVIERGRRRALSEMLEAARSGVTSAVLFRERILNYLESTQYSESLEAVLNDDRGGLSLVGDLIGDVRAPNEAAELRGQVGRYLETYPDQPALLYLRAMTEVLCADSDEETARQNFAASVRNAVDSYGLVSAEIVEIMALAIVRMPKAHLPVAEWLEGLLVERWPERADLRTLISETGVTRLNAAPWLLIDRIVRDTTALTSEDI